MVSIIISLNLGETSSLAKTAEISMGLVTFLGIGTVSGAVFYYLMQRVKLLIGYMPGMAFGAVVGFPFIGISLYMNYSVRPGATTTPLLSMIWLVILFVGWGVAFNWIYNDLTGIKVVNNPN